jgi:hypothetical protein
MGVLWALNMLITESLSAHIVTSESYYSFADEGVL